MSAMASYYIWWMNRPPQERKFFTDMYLHRIHEIATANGGVPRYGAHIYGPGIDVIWLPSGEVRTKETK